MLAAVAEIAGCFAFWAWLRMGKNALLIFPGIASLIAFAYFLTKINSDFAGRAYAAYGGIYILSSIFWMWVVEGQKPDMWDLSGVLLCVLGGLLILFGPR